MTEAERNELANAVAEVIRAPHKASQNYEEIKFAFAFDAQRVLSALESLGYEIVKKGSPAFRRWTKEEIAEYKDDLVKQFPDTLEISPDGEVIFKPKNCVDT